MGSRIRDNPERLFELFAEIARPTGTDAEPFVLQLFPDDYGDQEVLKSIPQFAFPCDVEASNVEHFTFVLTDIESKYKFGFCRHGTGANTCLCILSCLPWYEIFYRLLNQLAEILNRNEENHVVPLLQAFFKQEVPPPGTEVEVLTPNFKDVASPNKFGQAPNIDDKFVFIGPDPSQLCSIPDSRNLTEYYNAVDTNNMMIIFASMLYERRILITSRKLSRLTACVHGSAALLYPMHWQHLYIPILPPHLIDYCSAPMPYLIGIHSTLLEQAKSKQELGDAVILDCDANTVTTEYDDLGTLPPEIVSLLKKRLKAQQSEKMKSNLMGDGVSRAFLKALVALIGGYRDALKFRPGEQITFDRDAFIQSRPPSMKTFLENILQLQIFEQFINDRLELLNSGHGFNDEFENEANIWADKLGMQSEYKKWLGDMKERGKKLRREGKDKLVELTAKVGHKGKKAYKDIRSKIDRLRKEEESGGLGRQRPATLSEPQLTATRPPRPPQPVLKTRSLLRQSGHSYARRASYDRTRQSASRQYKVLDLENVTAEDAPRVVRRMSTDDLDMETLQRVSLNLMDDSDIQQMLKRSYSLEDVAALQEEDEEVEHALDVLNMDTLVLVDSSETASSSSLDPSDRSKSPTPLPLGFSELSEDTESTVGVPVPAPRRRHQQTEQPEPVLIKLDSSVSQLEKASHNQSDFSGINVYPQYTNMDSQENKQQSEFLNAPSQSSLDRLSDTSSQASDVQNNNDSDDNKQRTPVTRQNAFYKMQRPPSVKRRTQPMATDAQTIKEARKAFIESDMTKPSTISDSDFLEFDPLSSGQVAVDQPKIVSSAQVRLGTSAKLPEEDLLKEWNLDFGKLSASSTAKSPPPVPPKPTISPHNRHSVMGYPSVGNYMGGQQGLVQSRRSGQYFTTSGNQPQMGRFGQVAVTTVPTLPQNVSMSPPMLQPHRTVSIPSNLQNTRPDAPVGISPATSAALNKPARPLSQIIPGNTPDLFGDLLDLGGTKSSPVVQPRQSGTSHTQTVVPSMLPHVQSQPLFQSAPPITQQLPARKAAWETFD